MSRDDEQPPAADESVQDYLDLLLSRATEAAEARIDWPEQSLEGEQRSVQTGQRSQQPSLSIVAGQSLSRRTVSAPTPPKPLAESRPLTLKLPLAPVLDSPAPAPDSPAIVGELAPPAPAPAPTRPPEPPPASVPDSPVIAPATVDRADSPAQPAASPRKRQQLGRPWLENGRPDWAQQRFECLLFKVGGLTLAVPLVELGTIYPVDDSLTPLFGQIDWFMGLLPVKGGNIRMVNTARVVMPERYRDAMQEDYRYVISIAGVDWGLAVDSVSEAISLVPEQVKWRRSDRSNRLWLAGTVVDHMCALLDLGQLADMLSGNER